MISDLRGVGVLSETKLEVTNSPRTFHWEEYGLKLIIPPQSLPTNADCCTITITASLSGQYQFLDDMELVSPVFWLRCEPRCIFACPLSLEIEHCALTKNINGLSMVRAASTQKDLPYPFEMLDGGVFCPSSKFGVIKMRSFSGVGVAQKKSMQRRYWSGVFYLNEDIHFAVTWHDNAHIKVS